ncbi:MAG: ABC transporter ATP-binding protein/permease [Clostridiaceae bacterium]|jgi:ATP-binding cassette subfamily B protein|nr:ABC transporter ATP-binding protein/permease [Clostridiaceae bacterium]
MSDNVNDSRDRAVQSPRRGGPMGGGPMGMGRMSGGKAKNFKKSMGKLIKYLQPHLLYIVISLIFMAGATVCSIIAPSYIGKLTDEIFVSMLGRAIDLTAVASFGITLMVFYATSLILNYLQAFIMAGVNQKVSRRLRSDISRKINVVPLKYFDGHSYGDTLSRVTNDVDTIGQTLNQSISSLFSSIIMLIGVLIAMFVTSWQLSITAMLTVPLSLILIMVMMGFSQKFFRSQQQALGEINGHIEENFSGQSVIKAFNGEEEAQEKFGVINKKLVNSSKNSQFLSGLMMPIMSLVSNIGYIAVCVVGGILFVNGSITAGVIASFFVYIRLFQNPMMQIAQAAGNLQGTAAASERVFEFLDEKEKEDESEKFKKIETVQGKVEFKNVNFSYDGVRTIINDFSATVQPGQKVAIVGPTGAGKTTMINLLMRFYEINGGDILIDGVSIKEMKREDVRALFGMVLQDTWLFDGTIRDNVVYAKKGVTQAEIEEACRAANIDRFIATLPNGYGMELSDEVSISSGQRQLLTIARAMVQNSPMLILDEATSNVDTRTESLIQDAMDKITKGRTSFVIAHRLSTVKNADLILVMKEGDIIEAGSHEQLLSSKGFYSELYNSQFSLESV